MRFVRTPMARAGHLFRGIVTLRKHYPTLDLRPGESTLRKSHAIRVWGIFGYQGQATLTTNRFIFEPQRFYTRPHAADPALGGSRIEIPFSAIRSVTVLSWVRIRFRGLPWLHALEVTAYDGRKHAFQIPSANDWCADISSRTARLGRESAPGA